MSDSPSVNQNRRDPWESLNDGFSVIMVGGPDEVDRFWFEQKSYSRAEAEAIVVNFRRALDFRKALDT